MVKYFVVFVLSGSSPNVYYRTPAELFSGGEHGIDPADTALDLVNVITGDDSVKQTVASGVRIFLPEIPGVGKIRTR